MHICAKPNPQGASCMSSGSRDPDTANNVKLVLTPVGKALLDGMFQNPTEPSEDCLTVNVWTKPQTGETTKAVLMFIYGGGFTTGSSAIPWYDGKFIANDGDVVVVTFKYVSKPRIRDVRH